MTEYLYQIHKIIDDIEMKQNDVAKVYSILGNILILCRE